MAGHSPNPPKQPQRDSDALGRILTLVVVGILFPLAVVWTLADALGWVGAGVALVCVGVFAYVAWAAGEHDA